MLKSVVMVLGKKKGNLERSLSLFLLGICFRLVTAETDGASLDYA
jgi:hypothetical protein